MSDRDEEPQCGFADGGSCYCTGRPGCLAAELEDDEEQWFDDGEPWPADVFLPPRRVETVTTVDGLL